MTKLVKSEQRLDYDDLYRKIVQAHRGFSDNESAQFNARLILLLANQIGDMKVIEEALALARDAGQSRH